MLMLMVGATTAITSCKKDKKSEKEQNLEHLQSGKWYVQQMGTNTCYDERHFFEFKKDGTIASFDGPTTYTLSEDGKTLTIAASAGTWEITEISSTKLTFKVTSGSTSTVWQLAKTPQTPTRC